MTFSVVLTYFLFLADRLFMATIPRTGQRKAALRAKAKIDSAGRILVPVELRRALGVEPGQYLMMRVKEEGLMEVWTVPHGVRRVQEMIAKYVPRNVSLVDDLIAERRAEAAREDAEIRGE